MNSRYDLVCSPIDSGDARVSPAPANNAPEVQQKRFDIYLAEDNRADVGLVREALELYHVSANLTVFEDGDQVLTAIDRIEAQGSPCPDLVLLDLNLPKLSGIEVLTRMRQTRSCASTPVIIMTSSKAARDREAAARLGIKQYFAKPLGLDEFLRIREIIASVLQEHRPN